jgi:hypothetical protein
MILENLYIIFLIYIYRMEELGTVVPLIKLLIYGLGSVCSFNKIAKLPTYSNTNKFDG